MHKTKEVWDKTKACARGKETSPSHFAPYLVDAQGGGVHSGTMQTSSGEGGGEHAEPVEKMHT